MKAEWIACLKSIAIAHQSYSVAGRSFTRANLTEVRNTLGEIIYALNIATGGASGGVVREVYSDLSRE